MLKEIHKRYLQKSFGGEGAGKKSNSLRLFLATNGARYDDIHEKL